jgi:hypothetical protein
MATPTSRQIKDAIARQHPDAGVLILDGQGGRGTPRTLGFRPRDDEADERLKDAVVVLNPPPRDDPRRRA